MGGVGIPFGISSWTPSLKIWGGLFVRCQKRIQQEMVRLFVGLFV
jgi:hypothetical protein